LTAIVTAAIPQLAKIRPDKPFDFRRNHIRSGLPEPLAKNFGTSKL